MTSTISAIYGARRNAGLDDDTARDLYERETGKRSLREMTPRQQVLVLQALRRSCGAGSRTHPDMAGPYAGKLRALWISGWNLGVVHDRRDAALLAFVTRQTGIEAMRFLRAPADARRAVEALKKWLARQAGVEWGHYDDMDAVIFAQGAILHLGEVDPEAGPLPAGTRLADVEAFGAWRRDELDRDGKIAVSQQLGDRVRQSGHQSQVASNLSNDVPLK